MGSRLEANSSAVRKRIEGHSFSNEEGEEYEASKFGGFNDYFRRKKIKLQNLDAERRANAGKPPIFCGVVAHVNGYTQPSLNDLHNLIVDHGGGFLQYLDGKTTVTHVIASNLTPKKKVEFRNYRIVKPAWVVDSVAAGKPLPWNEYRVVDEGDKQHVLGFQGGSMVSQANTQRTGYREQTDSSWYTSQVKDLASRLDQGVRDEPPSTSDPLAAQFREEIEKSPSHPNSASEECYATLPPETNSASSAGVTMREPRRTSQHDILGATGNITPESRGYETDGDAGVHSETQSPRLDNSILSQDKRVSHAEIHGSDSDSSDHSADRTLTTDKNKALTAEEHNAMLLANPKVWKSTVVNPAFLKQYYEESRLHHLSAWKAELKSQLQALAEEQTASQKSRSKRPQGARRYILHVDFDCFFAAVSLKDSLQWVDRPVVVAHGGGSGAEIASCNYPARRYGIKNGMWMKSAQQLCPDLKVLPYNFKAYEAASKDFYAAAMETGGIIQSVSIDEALLDVSVVCIEAGGGDGKSNSEGSIYREQAKADEIANGLRTRVRSSTGCEVSVGIGANILLAKVALRKAKPAGQYQIRPEEVLDFIGALTVQELPGVASSIGGKLEEIGVKLVKDIRDLSKERLMTSLGPKTGGKIWDYARGIDRVEVGEQPIRKSVSAEVNWGVRFATQEQADEFVRSLCEELHKRLVSERVKGHQLTMKLMRKAANVPLDPPKHLGHGPCDVFNKSVTLRVATNDTDMLGREAILIMKSFGFPPGELRGIGVQVTKLEPLNKSDGEALGSQRPLQFKKHTESTSEEPNDIIETPEKPKKFTMHPAAVLNGSKLEDDPRSLLNTLGTQFVLPSQVDPEVLAELPEDVRAKLAPRSGIALKTDPRQPSLTFKPQSRSPTSVIAEDNIPSASQLDPEALAALPDELRKEVLAFYHESPQKAQKQAVLPQSPHKTRAIKMPKTVTPKKKRGGLSSRGRGRGVRDSGSTLTQSNFVSTRLGGARATDGTDDEIAPDFLAALPEDIRLEVLAQQRSDRLRKRNALEIIARKKARPIAPQAPRVVSLPPRPLRPTFTTKRLSSLSELREAISSWVEEFGDEEPNVEDVNTLVAYLRKVVLDEKDMSKAVSVVKWLDWTIKQDHKLEGFWRNALRIVKDGVQSAVQQRGLGRVSF